MLILYTLLFGCLDTTQTLAALSKPDTTDSSSSQNQTNTRSRFNIIWNCWTIIFICTWVSIHPNIPPPREKPLPALWRRAKLMLWALIVPELILAWAIRQWMAAKMIEEEFKEEHKWTRVHGHFLNMGGFTLVNSGRPAALSEMPAMPEFPTFVRPERPEEPKLQDYERAKYRELYALYLEDKERYTREKKSDVEDLQRFWKDMHLYHTCSNADINSKLQEVLHIGSPLGRELSEDDKNQYRDYEKSRHHFRVLHPHLFFLILSPGTLSLGRFKDLVNNSLVNFPNITAAEIQDRAKGDFLSKSIAILQSSWFIIQCIARGVQGLAITELELVTLALASLNGVIYYFWWDKPLGINEPVQLYLMGAPPLPAQQHDLGNHQSLVTSFLNVVRNVVKGISLACTNLWKSFRQWIEGLSEEADDISLVFLRMLFFAYHRLLYIPISAVIESLYTIVNSDTVPLGATHVSTFYSSPGSELQDKVFITLILPFTGVFFGGLHCIGWNFDFPTTIEKVLWRIMSLLITCIPAVSIFTFCLYRVGVGLESTRIQKASYPGIALGFVYVFARLFLLAQALSLLRRQPESAYQVVDWSKFVPHISW